MRRKPSKRCSTTDSTPSTVQTSTQALRSSTAGSFVHAGAAGLSLPKIHTKFVPDLKDLAHIDRAYVERIITRSLSRLGVERLDMVQFHWWDYEVPGMVDTADISWNSRKRV
ncbi:MAG: aldo/keto reductase [Sutterella seckii]